MNHNIVIDGAAYRLRPVKLSDAQFIIDIRLDDIERNRFINKISPDKAQQEEWIREYFLRDNDYYFVIENLLSGEPEGLISVYNIQDGKGEWGRWVIKKSSLAAIESVDLIFKASFEYIGLSEVYCRTIEDNHSVVAFHDSLNELRRGVIEKYVEINEAQFNVVEHYVTKEYYYNNIQDVIEDKSLFIYKRNLRKFFGEIEFHHIGVATTNIEKEFSSYRTFGYRREDKIFKDEVQGIRGQFIISDHSPRLELLENLPGRNTLDKWNEANIKNYHFAYKIKKFDSMLETIKHKRIRILAKPEISVYFKKRICFVVLPNKFIIEFIEE
ncbi:GNAT family N-acetyltransferase [Mixta tenebrionis]|uniref:GNAT family N-acetyltransferase n=1 Tax=Mixta tenebrionis TaxID=2562439 RepID=A0A506V988_9GAMM|nr:GNAT family N-acetyltransferase [Mixta tenebrionis]TPW42494.1 GNAT family N-acetyltransferase [Mixta tenebrionis]